MIFCWSRRVCIYRPLYAYKPPSPERCSIYFFGSLWTEKLPLKLGLEIPVMGSTLFSWAFLAGIQRNILGQYLEISFGCFLPLLVHCRWRWSGEGSNHAEESETNKHSQGNLPCNCSRLSWWCLCSRAVRTESYPVCYGESVYAQWLAACATRDISVHL